jgi:diguanylate cyclase (GGDEF)-like protein
MSAALGAALSQPSAFALALTGAGTLVGAFAAQAVWRRFGVVARLAQASAPFANPRNRALFSHDETARLAAGLAGLTETLDETRRRADPARLEDPLTGVPNRLAATRRARDEISRARRASRPLSAALIELSCEGADSETRARLIRIAAEMLSQSLRAYDQIGRWRDDVFVTVMPEAEIEHAVAAAQRFRDRVLADPAMRPDGVETVVRAGVAVLQPDDATLLDIAERADRALDRARERGVGRVEAAPGPRSRPGRLVTV